MDEMSCDTERPWWLIYFNPANHPDRPRFVGACETRDGVDAALTRARAERSDVDYRAVERPASGELADVRG